MHWGLNLCVFSEIYESEMWDMQVDDHCMWHQNMFSLGVKDAMIGHQTFQVKQNHDKNFYTKSLKQKDWTVKTSSDKLTLTCVNMHVFCKSGFTSSITMKYWQ